MTHFARLTRDGITPQISRPGFAGSWRVVEPTRKDHVIPG